MTDQQPRDVVFVDCETSGTDPQRHDVWEVAAWNLTTGHRCEFFVYLPDVSKFLARAEIKALRVNRFLDRYPWDDCPGRRDTATALSGLVTDVLYGGRNLSGQAWQEFPDPVVVASNPGFDLSFLAPLLGAYDMPSPVWHHHPIDLGAYAAGVLGVEVGAASLSARAVAELVGVDPGDHSAGADVTSGGRAFLLLREAARLAHGNHGDGLRPAHLWVADLVEEYAGRPTRVEADLIRPPMAVTS